MTVYIVWRWRIGAQHLSREIYGIWAGEELANYRAEHVGAEYETHVESWKVLDR